MKICFFARVRDEALFQLVEFYRMDIDILRSLGHEVVCINRFGPLLNGGFDLYFVWWFGYGVAPALAGRLRGKPVIATGAIHTPSCGPLDDWPFHKRIAMKATMRLADASVFISRTDFGKLGSFRPRRSEIAYCAVDVNVYAPSAPGAKRDVVATVTHLTADNVARKLLVECVESFAIFAKSHPTYTYEICGSPGDGSAAILGAVERLGIADKVKLLGRLGDSEKIGLLRTARIYLQPSSCEGFGLALLEAQACGTPVVTSREPCIAEINRESVLYGETKEQWSARMAELADDAQGYERWRRQGLENAARFSGAARRAQLQRLVESVAVPA